MKNKKLVMMQPYEKKKDIGGYNPPTKDSPIYKYICDESIADQLEYWGSVAIILKDKTLYGFPMKFVRAEPIPKDLDIMGFDEIYDFMGIAEGVFVEEAMDLSYMMLCNSKLYEDSCSQLLEPAHIIWSIIV